MASLAATVYPQARRDETVIEDYHGRKIADPYRWLEDPDSPETEAFVKALNDVSVPFLEECPIRDQIRDRLTELWDYPRYGTTSKHGRFYFYSYNSGLLNQSMTYIQESLEDEGKVFLDPNLLSEDGTTSVGQLTFTEDGSLLAYNVSEKGSDWQTAKFKKVPSGEDLPDVLTKLKFTGLAWDHEHNGVFYSMYPGASRAVGSVTEQLEFHSLYYHRLGTEQTEDMLCYDFPENPEYMINAQVTEDGRFLICSADKGCDPHNLLFLYNMQDFNYGGGKLNLKPIIDEFETNVQVVDNDGDTLILLTNMDAPMFKLVTVDAKNPEKENWKTLVAENENAKLDWATIVDGNKLILCYMEDVKDRLYIHDLKTGERLHQIPLDIGTVCGFFGKKTMSEIFFGFNSFLDPGSVYRLDFKKELHTPEVLRRTEVKGFNRENFETEQVFYPSRDGTMIPMYLIHKKGLVKNGENTTMLYGYGGFNLPVCPTFSVSRLMYIQNMGGVYASVNLRGGSEYGERWHEAAMKEKKQNVFDDFIAAAEYLIETKYTQPEKLMSHGGSNGGLVVAVCAEQRPDLFAAVLNRVGVLDMLRYHKFTIGKAWVPEFGSPDVKEDFQYLIKYSPLHNIYFPKEKGGFPSMLLTTADHDDRVVPLHSLKYIAEIYHTVKDCSAQNNPLLVRVEVKAGHGHGKPTKKLIEEVTDIYCFVARVMGVTWQSEQ